MFDKDGFIAFNQSPHSPHSIIFNLIKPNSKILDVGCNSGSLGKELLKKNVISDGIDINKDALEIAKKYYRKVLLRDLYNPCLNLSKEKYDYIIFSDLLEHIPRPDLLLKDSKNYLKNNGRIIASIPNIARFEIRLKLLFGNFDYKPGIMSQDHLRFFTRKTANNLFINNGYIIEKIIPTGLGHIIKVLSSLTAFQFVFVCNKN